VTRLPDFIIIGAMKCATTSLHEQLARQPGIIMSDPKEPNFFSDDSQYARGLDWYGSCFARARGGELLGESSTHYTKLPTHPRTIERMRLHLTPAVRFIYVMRHPIDRLISQYIHEWTQRVISVPIDQAIEAHPELIAYSRYAMQLRPYIDAFGREAILPVFNEAIRHDPQSQLERVARHIGYRQPVRWEAGLSDQNVSSDRVRKHPVRDAILNLPGAAALRRTLVPKSVRNRIRSLWTMKRRPELSAASAARLRELFDEDLTVLGQWLDLPLRCENFKAVAAESSPRWRLPVREGAA
jgi:hypothetical protein